jgi:hypothetical protein
MVPGSGTVSIPRSPNWRFMTVASVVAWLVDGRSRERATPRSISSSRLVRYTGNGFWVTFSSGRLFGSAVGFEVDFSVAYSQWFPPRRDPTAAKAGSKTLDVVPLTRGFGHVRMA